MTKEDIIDCPTVRDLFTLAIQLERTAEILYSRLAEKFSAHPAASLFWKLYAADEAHHADWLSRLQEFSDPDRLDAPADPFLLLVAQDILNSGIDQKIDQVYNLEDAYQLAVEVEAGETNAIFNFLVEHATCDADTRSFLLEQLDIHIKRLDRDFPSQLSNHFIRLRIPAG